MNGDFRRRLLGWLCLLAVTAAAEPTASGRAMQQLTGIPYQLYATQTQTERHQALNCVTSVIDALRRSGLPCPELTFHQARSWWLPRAKPLPPGKTPFPPGGALLITREHLALLNEDADGDGLIGNDDLIIHAYYQPVTVESFTHWRRNSPPYPLYYLPLDTAFTCPDAAEAARLPRIRSQNRHNAHGH